MKYGPFTAIMLVCLLFSGTARAEYGWGDSYSASHRVAKVRTSHRTDWSHSNVRLGGGSLGTNDQRPRAWCGWYMRQRMGVADRSYNVASRWLNWGHHSIGPCAGCLAVSRHHVALLHSPGSRPGWWVIEDGNNGRGERIHESNIRSWAVAYRAP